MRAILEVRRPHSDAEPLIRSVRGPRGLPLLGLLAARRLDLDALGALEAVLALEVNLDAAGVAAEVGGVPRKG